MGLQITPNNEAPKEVRVFVPKPSSLNGLPTTNPEDSIRRPLYPLFGREGDLAYFKYIHAPTETETGYISVQIAANRSVLMNMTKNLTVGGEQVRVEIIDSKA